MFTSFPKIPKKTKSPNPTFSAHRVWQCPRHESRVGCVHTNAGVPINAYSFALLSRFSGTAFCNYPVGAGTLASIAADNGVYRPCHCYFLFLNSSVFIIDLHRAFCFLSRPTRNAVIPESATWAQLRLPAGFTATVESALSGRSDYGFSLYLKTCLLFA